jgi:hypothetical protein
MVIRWAACLMFAGAMVAAAEEAAQIALLNSVTYSGNGGGFFEAVGVYFVGIPVTALECGLWLWMAWTAVAGHDWARILSTVFFGVMSLMLVHFLKAFPSPSGVTSTGPFIGTVPLVSALPLISVALEWLAGLAALILLWQRASSQFFTASRQARAMALRLVSS